MLTSWPPHYTAIFKERVERIQKMRKDPSLVIGANAYYKDGRCAEFINDWLVTYNPRNAGTSTPSLMPFCTFPKQDELIEFLMSCLKDKESGLIEKSRDMGATWLCCGVSIYLWRFWDGAAVGWGSRKEQLVDKIGDPDSIFEKMRMMIRYLPEFMLPPGFSVKDNMPYMKIINPDNGATITGESGDNIGRGGRKLLYFKDEAAHYERPELIEAALGDNTNTQIDISSVNGTANVFYRRRMGGEEWTSGSTPTKGKTRVFIMDWRDHPHKTQEWYDARKQKAEDEGLSHVFAQEVDRDYASSVVGVCIPAKWVRAAVDAHIRLGFGPEGEIVSGLDVADEGADKNAQCIRQGAVPLSIEVWPEGDTTQTATRSIETCKRMKVTSLQYDCIGVGAGVKGEINRMKRETNDIPSWLDVVAWDAGSNPLNPDDLVNPEDNDGKKNKDFYENLKAQGWWSVRTRFEKTYKMINGIRQYPLDELITLPSNLEGRHQLENELSQPTIKRSKSGKLMIDKKPSGSMSPNMADSFIQAFHPCSKKKSFLYV